MSILDGLVRRDWDGFPSEDGTVVAWDDVREALTNPTDEQVKRIVSDYALQVTLGNTASSRERIIRAVLAAAAGDDQ